MRHKVKHGLASISWVLFLVAVAGFIGLVEISLFMGIVFLLVAAAFLWKAAKIHHSP